METQIFEIIMYGIGIFSIGIVAGININQHYYDKKNRHNNRFGN